MNIRDDIKKYITKNEISFSSIGKELDIHENSIRHFFVAKSENSLNIIGWYLKSINKSSKLEKVPLWKKRLICNEITDLSENPTPEKLEDIRNYIMKL